MHNVNVDALATTTEKARENPGSVRQQVAFDGDWQTDSGRPQFRATIPFPNGETIFEADFPPPWEGAARPRTRLPTASGAVSPVMS